MKGEGLKGVYDLFGLFGSRVDAVFVVAIEVFGDLLLA